MPLRARCAAVMPRATAHAIERAAASDMPRYARCFTLPRRRHGIERDMFDAIMIADIDYFDMPPRHALLPLLMRRYFTLFDDSARALF